MKCQQCEAVVLDDAARCERCGATLTPRQARTWPAPAPFSLTAENAVAKTAEESAESGDFGFVLDRQIDEMYGLAERKEALGRPVRWGGFLRRTCAFVIDLAVLFLLSTLLLYTSYVGYSVGLSAHYRAMSLGRFEELLSFIAIAWLGLAGSYFVVFHGRDGQTVGKWVLGLKVVGITRSPITYWQAFIRWVGAMVFAPVALGFLWILLNREKRGWHDYLAGTWVIRE